MSKVILELNENDKLGLYVALEKEIFGYSLEDRIFELEREVDDLKDENEELKELLQDRRRLA